MVWPRNNTVPAGIFTLALAAAAVLAWMPDSLAAGGDGRSADRFSVTMWTTDDGLPDDDVVGVARIPRGHLLVATRNRGVVTFDGVTFRPIPAENATSPRVHRLLLTADGLPIVSLLGGVIASLRDDRLVVEHRDLETPAAPNWLIDEYLGRGIGCDLFRSASGQVLRRRIEAGRPQWEKSPGDQLARPRPAEQRDAADGHGGRWVVGSDGLRHETADGSAGAMPLDGEVAAVATSLCLDDEGNLWAGLARRGLARIRRSTFYSPRLVDGGSLPAGPCSLCEDELGTIWLTSQGGGVWKSTREDDSASMPRAFESVMLPGLEGDHDSVIAAAGTEAWAVSQFRGLFRLDVNGWTKLAEPSGFGNVARAILPQDGLLWLASEAGLFRFSTADRTLTQCPIAVADVPGPVMIEALAAAADGGLWLGLAGDRLVHRSPDGFCTTHQPPWASAAGRFWAVLPDASIPGREAAGGIWLGTLGSGLVWFEPSTRQFRRLSTAEGLPDDTVCQILADATGSLWLGTFRGIVRIAASELQDFLAGRRRTVSCRRFGVHHGLPAAQCSAGRQPGCLATRDGSLWFSTDAGVVIAPPEAQAGEPPPPSVVIAEAVVAGRDHLVSDGPVRLAATERMIEFSFAGLWLASPDDIRYRWRIRGIDQDWVEGGRRRTANYERLPPGQHLFEVQAAHVDGPWAGTPARIGFSVAPFLHETTWFRGLAAAAALAIAATVGGMGIRSRHRRQFEVLERERLVERERARIARDLHDDLGASLTQIDLLGALAERGDATAAAEHLAELRTRAHETVAALDEIVWAVSPGNDSLGSLVGYLADFVQSFARAASVTCRLEIADVPADLPLEADVRHALFQAAKEAVTNAVRHSGGTMCEVAVAMRGSELVIEIHDDGQGLLPAATGGRTGHGLSNMAARMEAIGGRVLLDSAPGRGTRVSLAAAVASGSNGAGTGAA